MKTLRQILENEEGEDQPDKPVTGLPQKPIDIGGGKKYIPRPNGKIRKVAEGYMKSAGLPYNPPKDYKKVDPERATRIADEFHKMKHDPEHPAVKASYQALAKETMAQYQHVKKAGLKVEWMKEGQPDPYAKTPRLSNVDVEKNNHLWAYKTEHGFGSGDEDTSKNHPMLQKTGEVVDGHHMLVNDAFRVVHDYFGHHKEGFGFRADGEENAWRHHAAMFSEKAKPAMTAETRGQNSFVNYGPHGDHNRKANAAETHYAPQKAGIMPKWVQEEGK
jgi:hypothetical protein